VEHGEAFRGLWDLGPFLLFPDAIEGYLRQNQDLLLLRRRLYQSLEHKRILQCE
jgi:hypothetical protein